MSEPSTPPADGREPESPTARAAVEEYVEHNLSRYTPDALAAAAIAAGFSELEVRRAIATATEKGRPPDIGAPARWLVIGAYLITYLVLMAGLLSPGSSAGPFGGLAAIILTIVLGLAFLISLGWLAMDVAPSFAALVSVPLVLLVLVGGSCVATTGVPFSLLPG